MIRFNPENKTKLTYGECLEPTTMITTQQEADEYLKDYISFIQKSLDIEPNPKGLKAEQIAKINIGYWTGYTDNNTAKRMMKLFKTTHPIFGDK